MIVDSSTYRPPLTTDHLPLTDHHSLQTGDFLPRFDFVTRFFQKNITYQQVTKDFKLTVCLKPFLYGNSQGFAVDDLDDEHGFRRSDYGTFRDDEGTLRRAKGCAHVGNCSCQESAILVVDIRFRALRAK